MNLTTLTPIRGTSTRRLCTFMLGDLLLGADISAVEEAVRDRPVTPVPLAHPTMAGVINLRGRIISVIDLRARLGMPAAPEGRSQDGPHLVVHASTGSVSLIVDEFVSVIEVAETDIDDEYRTSAPPHLPDALRDSVAAIYRLEPQLLIELDLAQICQPTTN